MDLFWNARVSIFSPFILENESQPWWMVDMGSSKCVGTVVVFNRVDCNGEYLYGYLKSIRSIWQLLSNNSRITRKIYKIYLLGLVKYSYSCSSPEKIYKAGGGGLLLSKYISNVFFTNFQNFRQFRKNRCFCQFKVKFKKKKSICA